MPKIPFIAGSNPLADAAAPVRDNERRPTVDNSGIAQGVGNLARAGKQPLLPDALAEPYSAMGAVGRAVSEGGNIVTALAIKEQEARTHYQTAEADGVMAAADEEWEAHKLNNPDPVGWRDARAKQIAGVKSKILANDKLTPAAREAITLRLTRHEGMALANVGKESAQRTFKLAASSSLAAMDRFTEVQDPAGFNATLTDAANKGYLFPHEVEAAKQRFTQRGVQIKAKIESEAFDSAQNSVVTIARAEGADAAKLMVQSGTLGQFPALDAARLEQLAEQTDGREQANFSGMLAEGLASGEINSEAKIKELAAQYPMRFRATLQEKARDYLKNRDEDNDREEREKFGVENAVALRQWVKEYDPAKDAELAQYFDIVRETRSKVPEEMRGEILGELYKKAHAEAPKMKIRPEIQRTVSKTLDALFDAETGSIPWKKKVPKTWKDSDGKVKMKGDKPLEVTDKTGNVEYETVEDLGARQKAIKAQAIIERKMFDWFQANPALSDNPAAVQKALNDLLPEGTQMGALDSIFKAAPPRPAGKMSSANRAALETLPEPSGVEIEGDILPPLGAIPFKP